MKRSAINESEFSVLEDAIVEYDTNSDNKPLYGAKKWLRMNCG
jgi:hypothetical protein